MHEITTDNIISKIDWVITRTENPKFSYLVTKPYQK